MPRPGETENEEPDDLTPPEPTGDEDVDGDGNPLAAEDSTEGPPEGI